MSTVSVVDLDRQEVVDTLTVERAPVGMGLGRRGDRIYAANRGTGRVSVIDRASGREWARVPVGKAPGDLAVDQTTGTVYVSDAGTSTVSVFQDRLEGQPAELPSDWRHPLIGKPLPAFSLPGHGDGPPAHLGGVSGEEVHPELLRQLVRALQAEAPLLEEVRKRAEKYGLEIVMVNVWEHVDPRQEALHFCKIHNIQGTVLHRRDRRVHHAARPPRACRTTSWSTRRASSARSGSRRLTRCARP